MSDNRYQMEATLVEALADFVTGKIDKMELLNNHEFSTENFGKFLEVGTIMNEYHDTPLLIPRKRRKLTLKEFKDYSRSFDGGISKHNYHKIYLLGYNKRAFNPFNQDILTLLFDLDDNIDLEGDYVFDSEVFYPKQVVERFSDELLDYFREKDIRIPDNRIDNPNTIDDAVYYTVDEILEKNPVFKDFNEVLISTDLIQEGFIRTELWERNLT